MTLRGWILSVGIVAGAACLVAAELSIGGAASARSVKMTHVQQAGSSRAEPAAFNKRFIAAHLRMDYAAVMSMGAEDGVSLLPTTEPMIGKETIGKFMDDVVKRMPGYHMQKIDIDRKSTRLNSS